MALAKANQKVQRQDDQYRGEHFRLLLKPRTALLSSDRVRTAFLPVRLLLSVGGIGFLERASTQPAQDRRVFLLNIYSSFIRPYAVAEVSDMRSKCDLLRADKASASEFLLSIWANLEECGYRTLARVSRTAASSALPTFDVVF